MKRINVTNTIQKANKIINNEFELPLTPAGYILPALEYVRAARTKTDIRNKTAYSLINYLRNEISSDAYFLRNNVERKLQRILNLYEKNENTKIGTKRKIAVEQEIIKVEKELKVLVDQVYKVFEQAHLVEYPGLIYKNNPDICRTEEGLAEYVSMHIYLFKLTKAVRFKDDHKSIGFEKTIKNIFENISETDEDSTYEMTAIEVQTSGIKIIGLYDWEFTGELKLDTGRRKKKAKHKHGFYLHQGKRSYFVNQKGNLIHRVICNIVGKRKLQVHHINGNDVDNRRRNLMILTKEQHDFFKTEESKVLTEKMIFAECPQTQIRDFNEELDRYKYTEIYEKYLAEAELKKQQKKNKKKRKAA